MKLAVRSRVLVPQYIASRSLLTRDPALYKTPKLDGGAVWAKTYASGYDSVDFAPETHETVIPKLGEWEDPFKFEGEQMQIDLDKTAYSNYTGDAANGEDHYMRKILKLFLVQDNLNKAEASNPRTKKVIEEELDEMENKTEKHRKVWTPNEKDDFIRTKISEEDVESEVEENESDIEQGVEISKDEAERQQNASDASNNDSTFNNNEEEAPLEAKLEEEKQSEPFSIDQLFNVSSKNGESNNMPDEDRSKIIVAKLCLDQIPVVTFSRKNWVHSFAYTLRKKPAYHNATKRKFYLL